MKIRMVDKDGIAQTRYINPKNYDPKRMEIVESEKNFYFGIDNIVFNKRTFDGYRKHSKEHN